MPYTCQPRQEGDRQDQVAANQVANAAGKAKANLERRIADKRAKHNVRVT